MRNALASMSTRFGSQSKRSRLVEKKRLACGRASKAWRRKNTCVTCASVLPASRAVASAALGIGIALYGRAKRSLDASGALSASVVGAITFCSSTRLGITLIAFFLASSKITKYKQEKKSMIEKEFKAGGSRDWKQVLANGGLPTVMAACLGWYTSFMDQPMRSSSSAYSTALMGAFLGYYACCCGDTWSSELGILSKSKPRLITNWKQVPAGTNGGVSPLGLFAAALGGLFVGVSFAFGGYVACGDLQKMPLLLGCTIGFLGSILDSLLGATLQFSGYDPKADKVTNKDGEGILHICGIKWLDNDAVNASSATVCSLISSWASLHLF